MLRVGIVGCGKIADSHASQIRRIRDCTIVGACDREELMAEQFAQRFGIPRCFDDLSTLIDETAPDVIHITTPPQSHYSIASTCLERGCHIYVEKPFTVTLAEAEDLVARAEKRGLKLTAGHDDQFSHVARELRSMVSSGYLGGPPVHIESHYGYDLSDSGYAKALLGNRNHWVRQLPGGLLHNVISHGIARIAEYILSSDLKIAVDGFASPFLRALGDEDLVDELRVMISSEDRTTAYFTFSSQMRPLLHQFRLYGPKNGLLLDEDHQTLIRLTGARRKSYLEKFVSPLGIAAQYAEGSLTNIKRFLGRDFHMKSGMKFLIEGFYGAISTKQAVPIPYLEILRVSRIMEYVFAQLMMHDTLNPVSLRSAPGSRNSREI